MGHLIGNHVTYEPVLMLVFGIDSLPPSLLLVQGGYSATEDDSSLIHQIIFGGKTFKVELHWFEPLYSIIF